MTTEKDACKKPCGRAENPHIRPLPENWMRQALHDSRHWDLRQREGDTCLKIGGEKQDYEPHSLDSRGGRISPFPLAVHDNL